MVARKVIKTSVPPTGLIYVPQFLSTDEELELLETLAQIDYYDFILQGYAAKRKVFHFGYGYEFYTEHVATRPPFPRWLNEVRDRAAPLAGLDPTQMEQALVNMYVPGAGIGWHRDAPPFGPTVVGISLGSEEVMRFRRQVGDHFEMYKQPLERRSLYVLSGSSRSYWQHSLPPAKQLRYSITFRTVKEKYKTSPAPDESTQHDIEISQ